MERLDRELAVINKLGFANYFLIVWDFVRFAREQGIAATARGSGVGSLVSLRAAFEPRLPAGVRSALRAVPGRSTAARRPISTSTSASERRGEVIQYVKDKYGTDNVAQIGTFGTLAARAAIRDVGRALGLPIPRVDAVVALVPEELHITLAEALEKSADLKKVYDTDAEDPRAARSGDAASKGWPATSARTPRRWSSPTGRWSNTCPLQRIQGKEEVITQWAMGDVERAGLLKMDFLGLRNLTILSKVRAS